MSTPDPRLRLIGRRSECAALDALVARVRAGSSRALVLRGDSGVGKSALLAYLVQRASGCGIARATGAESEMELAFAGLHQLCAPFLDRLDRLPGPQQSALGTAFGLRDGGAPDRFLVGLALLSLLSDVAEDRPLVCVVDDAQWLDGASAHALGFVARRLGAESVGVVFAVRGELRFEGLAELGVEGLDDGDARALLETVVSGPVDERVRARIVAETRGNPLALLELPRGRTPAELAGGFDVDGGRGLSGRIEQRFRERLAPLPPATRLLLLVAAAEPVGDPLLIWRAAAWLGVGPDAAGPAAEAGLIEFGAQVRFRHPLVRSAAYESAALEERRRVERALAETTDSHIDPDRRAWHLAQATAGLDEHVAAELERSASRARARGGVAAEAAFHERAAELTPDPKRRAQRALAAAQSKYEAGASDAALRLLAWAQTAPLDELELARAQLLHARITYTTTRGRDAPPLLLNAAERLMSLDADLARETYLDAYTAASSADRLAHGADTRAVAAAVLAADWTPATRPCDLLLEALAVDATEGITAGAPALKRAVDAFGNAEQADLRWLSLACQMARYLGDVAAWDELTARQLELARDAGVFSLLPIALTDRLRVELFFGRPAVATSLAVEADAVVEATGAPLTMRAALMLANWRGRDAEALALIEAGRYDVLNRGEGLRLIAYDWGATMRYNALGRYKDALSAAERAAADPRALGQSLWGLAELIEAAARTGQPERASGALERVREIAEASGTEWALANHARAAALLAEGAAADSLYREAIERLSRIDACETLARAHLVYGEWLRRENRRVDAREHLRIAHTMATDMGMDAYAERARRELQATGETVRRRAPDTRDDLTPQEAQIALLAAEGQTNSEIGGQLFLSPRTVEWHLRKVFGKLAITSRRELRSALPELRLTAAGSAAVSQT